MEDKLTYEQIEREALKLKLQLEKTANFMTQMGNCNLYELTSEAIKFSFAKIAKENKELLLKTPIKL